MPRYGGMLGTSITVIGWKGLGNLQEIATSELEVRFQNMEEGGE